MCLKLIGQQMTVEILIKINGLLYQNINRIPKKH